MKKTLKILGIIIFSILLLFICSYLYLTDFGRKGILSNEPRNSKIEIPVTYNIGWWAYQDDLTIDSLKIVIIESKLNLFNSKSLISYSVYGKMKYDGHWEPEIKNVHLSERIEKDSVKNRIIEITPIISVKENETLKGGIKQFKFKNEHTIISNQWGNNTIKFICGNKEQIIILQQRK
ncbi:hypothetical protein GON26_00760 [Flavobacterium sp. GA093]|uniref:Uncharacterized protein n=1 Tax=Flavobacterium hydrocarbonoxydans TaxID=2683249 RepID=A0A6I4NJX6_9FLAO|nr:hypothetical protein [Flavobacterium hydrocarbonoxydans]MWB92885.1 hypothetical protein [Flavobacterium hydrocarbonoxydans]